MGLSPVFTRRAAAVALAVVGAIHLALADEYLSKASYLGVLFIAGGVASLYVAVRLWLARDVVAWLLGALVAAGMFAGFILSRTLGLPDFQEADWEPSGIVSLILEAGYLGGMCLWLRRRSRRWAHESRPRAVGEAAEQILPEPSEGQAAARRPRGPTLRRPERA